MKKTLTAPSKSNFRQHVLTTLRRGITQHEPFEDLSYTILHNISNDLVLIEDSTERKSQLDDFMRQIEEVQIIRRYNMTFETSDYNKQFNAALNHLSNQFKLRFSKYY